VEDDRNKRPSLKDVVDELEQLEAEIKKLLLPSVESNDLIVQVRGHSDRIQMHIHD
jgi:hypothetical protein